ncbi:MAG: hypothetical protein R6U67_14090 [Sodalinema sp.]
MTSYPGEGVNVTRTAIATRRDRRSCRLNPVSNLIVGGAGVEPA